MAQFRIGEQNICCQGQEPWEWTDEGEVGVSIKGKTMDPCCVRSVLYCYHDYRGGHAKVHT